MKALLQSASMPLLAILLQATIVAGLALLVGCLAAARSAAIRTAIYRAGVLSILVLLLAGPAVRMIVAPLIQFGGAPEPTVARTFDLGARAGSVRNGSPDRTGRTVLEVGRPLAGFSEPMAGRKAFRFSAAEVFSLVYLSGSALLLAGVFAGSVWLSRLRRNSTPHARTRRAVVSPQVKSAFAAGVLKGRIYLPADLEARYTPEVVDAILRHEAIHIDQRDCVWSLVSRMACAVSWMNPLTWILSAKLRQESEIRCDQLVLDSGIEPALYAGCLLTIAESFAASPAYAPVRSSLAERLVGIGIVTPKSQLSKRISLMLNSSSRPIVAVTGASKLRIASLFALVLMAATVVVSAPPLARGVHDATPEDTIKGFFDALNQRDWRGAISRIEGAQVEVVVPALERFPHPPYGWIKQMPHISHVSVKGSSATVQYEIEPVVANLKTMRFKPRKDSVRLRLVGGDWKIVGGDDAHGIFETTAELARDP